MSDTSSMARRSRVLFVTWDGPEYHYLESLFLPIFAALRGQGFDFDVLQFTWGSAVRRGSLLTAVLGARRIRQAVRARRSDIVLARSTLPALATLLARRPSDRWSFVFDLDGLPTDERVEFAGLDSCSPVARLQWAIERKAIRVSHAVISRSAAIAPLIVERGGPGTLPDKIFRVPNCRDEHRFTLPAAGQKEAARGRLGLPAEVPVIAYVGSSLGGKYRGDCLLDFFANVHRTLPSARLLILTEELEAARALAAARVPELAEDIVMTAAAADDVPFLLGAADLGTAFIEPTPSMRAAAAVKLGEYLLCGLPVVATRGIGDVHERLGAPAVLFTENNGASELARAADWFCSWALDEPREVRQRAAREAGVAEYGLGAGAESYARALGFSERTSSISRGAWLASE